MKALGWNRESGLARLLIPTAANIYWHFSGPTVLASFALHFQDWLSKSMVVHAAMRPHDMSLGRKMVRNSTINTYIHLVPFLLARFANHPSNFSPPVLAPRKANLQLKRAQNLPIHRKLELVLHYLCPHVLAARPAARSRRKSVPESLP